MKMSILSNISKKSKILRSAKVVNLRGRFAVATNARNLTLLMLCLWRKFEFNVIRQNRAFG